MMNNFSSKYTIILLHTILMMYSLIAVFSKKLSLVDYFCFTAIAYCCGIFSFLVCYAVVWQQILKRLPLTVVYGNKSIVVIWGMFWGWLLFGEAITIGKVAGSLLVILGVILYTYADVEKAEKDG